MVHLQVLGAAPGTPASLILVADRDRYLFNAGEGVQLGGLPGLFLTLADTLTSQDGDEAVNPAIHVHGPSGLGAIVEATRRFASHATVALQTQEIDQTVHGVFRDKNIAVDAFLLRRSAPPCCPCKRVREGVPDSDDHGAMETLDQTGAANDVAVCYRVRLANTPGKFDVVRAQQLGVPRGPLYARLVAGHDVVLDGGFVVRSADVVGPARPGDVFVVVECPSADFVSALAGIDGTGVGVVAHLTPGNVARSVEYRTWLEGTFAPDVTHLFCWDPGSHLHQDVLRAPAAQLAVMNWICSESFPNVRNVDCQDADTARPLTRYVFHPMKGAGLDVTLVPPPINMDEIIDGVRQLEGLQPLLRALSEQRQRPATSPTRSSPELQFFGTGAAAPSKFRSSSGIDVWLPDVGRYALLDCGEGVVGQMRRVHGPNLVPYLTLLKLVWISHKHADHHVGLANLIRERSRVAHIDDDLLVVAPSPVLNWLRQYAAHGADVLRCRLASTGDEDGRVQSWARRFLCLNRFESIPVLHCSESFGLVLESPAFKLVYSGDTRPSPALIQAGMGATVLIHEATFEDDLLAEAISKKHCTTREALQVGKEMKAGETILTHFSQRYPKVPCTTDPSVTDTTCVAFDLMKVRLDRIAILPPLLRVLDLVFSDGGLKLPL